MNVPESVSRRNIQIAATKECNNRKANYRRKADGSPFFAVSNTLSYIFFCTERENLFVQ